MNRQSSFFEQDPPMGRRVLLVGAALGAVLAALIPAAWAPEAVAAREAAPAHAQCPAPAGPLAAEGRR